MAKGPITAEQLAAHCTEKDCWIAVNDKVYDITSFLGRHPGGKSMLLLCSGRDATQLVQTYHPFTDAPYKILDKYYLAEYQHQGEKFEGPPQHQKFYSTVAQKVNKYFQDNQIDSKWSMELIYRSIMIYSFILLGGYLANWVNWSAYHLGLLTWFFAVVHGMGQALFGLQIMHDSSHASLTHYPWVWQLVGVTWDVFTGASFYSWLNQHTIGHHVYTNIRGMDPDIGNKDADKAELRRVSPSQKFFSYYRFQHLYSPLLYPFLAIRFRVTDFSINSTLWNGPIRVNPSPFWYNVHITGKVIFAITRILLPLLFSPLSVLKLIQVFLITEMITGAWLAFNFQVSHVADELVFFDKEEKAKCFDKDWAVLQVVTAQDYAHGDRVWTFLCGSLNYQIVHHLFPTVNQTHYAKIAPLVIDTCKEFGIPYKILPTFWSAVKSHFSFLAKMKDPEYSGHHLYPAY